MSRGSDVCSNPSGYSERAQEIRDEPIEDYASRRRFEITNPTRGATMARKTVEDYRPKFQT